MGKDLKGRELGVGISQRKDGLYTARLTDSRGKRRQKYFHKLQECRNWIALERQNETCGIMSSEVTVDKWMEYFLESRKSDSRSSTSKAYEAMHRLYISPEIGKLALNKVKPVHCNKLLSDMAKKGLSKSTIELTRTVLGLAMKTAVENDVILKNPVSTGTKAPNAKPKKESRFLTRTEQAEFLKASKGEANYNLFSFALQTGLRCGELVGLKWSDIDLDNGTISVNRTVERTGEKVRVNSPKTDAGKRIVPLTETAKENLESEKRKRKEEKIVQFENAEYVFLNPKGKLHTNNVLNYQLGSICKKIGIEPITMHSLRHTFATRCIEAGMRPKTLQELLGHSQLAMTMDLYVHVTDEEKKKEIENIESSLKVV